jgi:glycosyltransferase involved in cell wall biosynthesis|tara:strand:+ start:8793 stop:9722 length:930 start_codon:yes stop_codon:yes gene_type:complete
MGKTLTIALQTYDRPKYLSESITSILNQTFKDYELIILDNGSGPETVSVIKSFHDSRIRYIRNNINDLNFLNKAFELVNNKFLMIFHDDDVMNPYLIENLIDTIEKDDSINSVSCSINLMDENSKSIKKIRPRIFKNKNWKKTEYIKEYLLRGSIIPCPSTIYRSSIIKNNDLKYELEVGPAADLFLFFKINLLPGKMILLKKPLLNYRIHINQGSEQKRVELEIQVRQHIFRLLQENKLYTLSQKYLKASLGIILNILINDVISGKLKYNNALKHFDKLKNEKTSLINIYTIYWALIGVLRGIKNKIS